MTNRERQATSLSVAIGRTQHCVQRCDLNNAVCVCVCVSATPVTEHSSIRSSTVAHQHMPVGHRVIRGVAGCRAGQETGSSQAAGHQHHRHGLAVRQMQQDCSSRIGLVAHRRTRPSVTQSAVFDGALHVCVCVCVCDRRVSVSVRRSLPVLLYPLRAVLLP